MREKIIWIARGSGIFNKGCATNNRKMKREIGYSGDFYIGSSMINYKIFHN